MTSIPESHRDLLNAATGVMGTIGPDGRPQLTAVWFLADGDTLRISLNNTRQKVKNLRANPKVTLFILDPGNPQRYLEVRGDAEISDDGEYSFADRLGAKYGADLRQFDPPGASRVAVTILPVRVNAVDLNAG
jgi:PPOX class probable F420-dependent enzyme